MKEVMCVETCRHSGGSLSSQPADIVPCLLLTEFVPCCLLWTDDLRACVSPAFPPAQRIPPSIPAVSNDRRPPGPLRDAGPSGPLRVPPAPLFSPLQSPSIVSNPRSV